MATIRAALALGALVVAGCGHGTVSNDDDVSRHAAEHVVDRFFVALHDGRVAAACAQLPDGQQAGLGRLAAQRGGPMTCAGALRTLREFAAARVPGAISVSHDMGFLGALPHRATKAVDDVSVNGRPLGSIGLRRQGNSWQIAVVCDCR